MRMKKNSILFYVILVGPLSIALFLYGFFPLVNYDTSIATEGDIPKSIDNVRIKVNTLYQPVVKRLIIMVIDALRWNFVTGSIGSVAMPITSSLISNSSACLLQANVQPPTVTMPRIKAITTGMIPNFIDVALNFGSKAISGDNILHQAKKSGHKLIFYGDDTWISLFPSVFQRYDGVTSFVVTDFTEVDNNVTRHLDKELYNTNDWSIMILHYLGLDHIGHVHGPFSPFIKTKLKEMDNIIAQIQTMVQTENQGGNPTLFIVCGDHGMKDSGGHGGSSVMETKVPLIAIGGDCIQDHHFTEISQIDIAPTLAAILGVPIPLSNIGTVFLDTLYNLPVSRQLFILYYNARQVFDHFKKLDDYKSEHAYKKYLDTLKLHNAWLNTNEYQDDTARDIIVSYKIALNRMKEILTRSTIKYDFPLIIIAIIFLCHTMCIVTGDTSLGTASKKRITFYFALSVLLFALAYYISENGDTSLLHLKSTTTIGLILFIVIGLTINSYFLASIRGFSFLRNEKSENRMGRILPLFISFAHAVSLGGSSFVEEEHQIWYFYWATMFALILHNSLQKLSFHLRSCRNHQRYLHAQTCVKLLLLLIAHRILRKLNSTGDKYAHLPDIAGFLTQQENKLGLTILVVTGLTLLICIDFICEEKNYKQQSLIINTIGSVCIYLRHMQNNSVLRLPLFPQSKGIYEAQAFWLLLIIIFGIHMYRVMRTIRYTKAKLFRNMLYSILRVWIMIAAMLHQPYNIILLPVQVILCNEIQRILGVNIMLETSTFLYTTIGNVFYFYQGNSNSLATIDVAAGYIGIQSYMPFVNGFLLIVNTYTAPVLAYYLLIYHTILRYPCGTREMVTENSKLYFTWRLLPITVYTIIISIQRYHLFVWSVFSPKLLYESMYSMVICINIFIVLILGKFQEKINIIVDR